MIAHSTLVRLCRARDLLRETTCDERVSIRDVAKDADLSTFHFIRQFHALFGETPHQYRINARLEHARRMLALGEHSVTDVCMEVGFSSLGSFSDLFTRRVGASPSVYRRQVRSLVSVPELLPLELYPGCLTLMCRVPGFPFAISEKH